MHADIERALAEFREIDLTHLRELSMNERNRSFEQLTIWNVLRRWHAPTLEREDLFYVHTGAGDDNQLDGLAILVDGAVVRDPEHARTLLEASDEPTVEFVFLQATVVTSFVRAKMNEMVTGIENFFAERTFFPENAALVARRAVKDAIRAQLGEAARDRITVSVYFVALGRWPRQEEGGDGPLGWRAFAEQRLVRISEFSAAPNVEVLDEVRLREVIAQVTAADLPELPAATPAPLAEYSRTIPAPHLLRMPELTQVVKGYLGFIHARDLVALLEREDGQGLLDDVSFHNVRAFQGMDNEVNAEIARTLAGPEQDQFLLRNNGVTIVAKRAAWVEGELRLDNYQIVNGWQTSSVLYRQRNHLADRAQVYVPLKVIVTEDPDLRDGIVRSTNRQTAVTDLQQIGHTRLVRLLWEDLRRRRAEGDPDPIWLERRDGEYRDEANVPEARIVSVRDLLAAVTSTHHRQPHLAAAGPGALAPKLGKQIFADGHEPAPYIVAARILLHVRAFLEANRTLERFEHHLCYGLAMLVDPSGAKNPRDVGAERVVAHCLEMDDRLRSPANIEAALRATADVIQALAGPVKRSSTKWRDMIRVKKHLTVPLEERLLALRTTMTWATPQP